MCRQWSREQLLSDGRISAEHECPERSERGHLPCRCVGRHGPRAPCLAPVCMAQPRIHMSAKRRCRTAQSPCAGHTATSHALRRIRVTALHHVLDCATASLLHVGCGVGVLPTAWARSMKEGGAEMRDGSQRVAPLPFFLSFGKLLKWWGQFRGWPRWGIFFCMRHGSLQSPQCGNAPAPGTRTPPPPQNQTQRVHHQTPDQCAEDSLLKRQTRVCARKYQPAYPFSVSGTLDLFGWGGGTDGMGGWGCRCTHHHWQWEPAIPKAPIQ